MSTSPNAFPERRNLSNVSFSPISSEVMYVRIRKMSSEENISQTACSSRQISRRTVSEQGKNRNHSKSPVTDIQEVSSVSLEQNSQKEQTASGNANHNAHDPTPCLKHAAENISRKARDIPSEKINLCNSCSKSMLSYIFLVQDFLDSLSKEIVGTDASHCLQCARQEMRTNIAKSNFKDVSSVESMFEKRSNHKSNLDSTHRKQSDLKSGGSKHKSASHERRSGNSMFKGNRPDQEPQRRDIQEIVSTAHQSDGNNKKRLTFTDFNFTVVPPNDDHMKVKNISHASDEKRVIMEQSNTEQTYATDDNQQWNPADNRNVNQTMTDNQAGWSSPREDDSSNEIKHTSQHFNSYQPASEHPDGIPEFRTLKERTQPNYRPHPTTPKNFGQNDPACNMFERSPSLYQEDLDGIISTLSTAEREIYDSARDRAGWESLTESQERLVAPSGNLIASEAFVTSCRNNAEAIGCLVLGTSLLLCRTSRTLCVLVSEGVSTAFRNAFSAVFQVVQLVRSLDSLGTTKLALLEQPELGVTFERLNVWRLVQFTKCVYLNPDTLVIQNCDELFCREELSAVPDIGWPDCFNSGVFVYSPSVHTFWQLLDYAEKQGSYDGGDQGLLNSYFKTWSLDISKKLSFIYNLMANVSYTYTPAFRQFGRDVKIVQFHGSFKPWHVKFFTKTGQISPSSPVHPTYVQFVHIWINIFRITVLRLLSKEIQSYAASQEVISAVELLRFFPLPTESESDFFLTPPSVRLRLAEIKLNKSLTLPTSEPRRRKSAEFFRHANTEDCFPAVSEVLEKDKTESNVLEESKVKVDVSDELSAKENIEESILETDEVFKESKTLEMEEKEKDGNSLPGSEIGDYHGMKAWEQGRMDYEGTACSDNIIKRLQFFMNPKPK